MNLIAILIITLIILAIPFIIYFKSNTQNGKKSFIFACIIYLIIASPVIYGVINDQMVQYEDANIGLGISFFVTWFLTICAFLISLYFLIKKQSKGFKVRNLPINEAKEVNVEKEEVES